MSATLPPKPRLGPAPPARPDGPLAPDLARAWLLASFEHYDRVVEHGSDHTVAMAILAVHRAMEAYHRALQPACYGGTSNYG